MPKLFGGGEGGSRSKLFGGGEAGSTPKLFGEGEGRGELAKIIGGKGVSVLGPSHNN